jgi:dihydrodipicolinate synthase/N-acetylneuraminate lyase
MPSERKIEGILMPMPVAFKNDGAIDQAATDAIIDFYLASGVHGFFPLGTHGQGMVMEIDERKKVAEQIINRVKGRVPVVMHIGTANTLSSIELAKHAASLGVDAVGVVPPYYYPHDDYEVYAHYKAIAKSVPGVPLFIYDNTETTWVEITPAKANKIIEAIAPNPLAGIKVSFVAYDKLLGYVYQLPKSTGVFPGGIFSLYSGYSVGVRGAIHPPSTPFPETCVRMYEALKTGDLKAAQKEHDLLTRLMQVVGKYLKTHGRGVFCELMKLRGLHVERFPRWETLPFTEKDKADLKEGVVNAGFKL